MASLVKLNIHDGVARISIDAPPVNAQSLGVRRGLWEAISIAERDPRVSAIAILGAGANFSAGADISEFGQEGQDPWFGTLYNRIEDCTKPVVAGIAGAALGGGLELALACHFRIAAPDARMGLPEVKLGLVPGGGGTQRAPRLIGAEAALRLMLSGAPMSAKVAEKIGLIDGVVEGDLAEATVALARELGRDAAEGSGGAAPRRSRDARTGFADPAGYEAAVARARAALEADPARAALEAPHRVIECIECALLLPFATGLAYEFEAFEDLRQGRQSAALRHVFFAERKVARPKRLGNLRPGSIGSIGIVGGGPRGTALSAAAALAGIDVRLLEQDGAHLQAATGRLRGLLDAECAAGRIPAGAVEAAARRVRGAEGAEGLGGCDIVVETMPDESGLKADLLASLSDMLGDGPVLATSARSPALDALALPVAHRQRLIALRFSGPAHRAGLVEIGALEATAPEALARGFALARRLGKAALFAEPPVGPLVMGVGKAAADEMVRAGEAGEAEMNTAFATFGFREVPYPQAGRRDMPGWKAEKLARPVVLAMANAGALVLAQGAVENAAAIDVAMVAGYGFPRHMGGPMHWADAEGLARVERDLRARMARHGEALWEPAPQFDDLIKNGLGFADL